MIISSSLCLVLHRIRLCNSASGISASGRLVTRLRGVAWRPSASLGFPPSHHHASDDNDEECDQRAQENAQCIKRRLGSLPLPALEPHLLRRIDLCSWLDFLHGYGFNKEQMMTMLSQSNGRFLERATLVTAGLALATLKEAGVDRETSIALITQYPQLLHSDVDEIERMVHLLSRFSSGIDIKGYS